MQYMVETKNLRKVYRTGDEKVVALDNIDLAIEHRNNTTGVGGEVWVVGHHNNRVAFLVKVGKLFHNNVTGVRVEVTGWLVRQ